MNKIVYPTLIVILFFSCIVLFRNYKMLQAETEICRDKIISFDQYYKLMRFRENATIQNNGTKLFSDIILRDEYNNIKSLHNIVGDVPKIIIRYSTLACDICLEEELEQISSFIPKIGLESVAVFVSKENIRSLMIRRNSLPFNINIYIVEDAFIPFEQNNSNLFVFVLDKDLYVKDFFIPEKTLPNLSANYYETIFNKYWQ